MGKSRIEFNGHTEFIAILQDLVKLVGYPVRKEVAPQASKARTSTRYRRIMSRWDSKIAKATKITNSLL